MNNYLIFSIIYGIIIMEADIKMQRTQLSFPEQMLEQLDEEADKQGLPRAEVIRRIIYLHFQQQNIDRE